MRRHGVGEPLVIGLTGNIATGKSTVARMLADLGADTIDADRVAHRVMRPGTPAHAAIVETYGQGVLAEDGGVDRKRLGDIVFADPQALRCLETIVHPATISAIRRRIEVTPAAVVVIEAIKLFEAGIAEACDSVWVTVCRPEQQIDRLVAGRNLSREEARQRVEAQRPQEERAALADVVIDNSGSLDATRDQVVAAWSRVVGKARDQAG